MSNDKKVYVEDVYRYLLEKKEFSIVSCVIILVFSIYFLFDFAHILLFLYFWNRTFGRCSM